jgi:hypothetical protein
MTNPGATGALPSHGWWRWLLLLDILDILLLPALLFNVATPERREYLVALAAIYGVIIAVIVAIIGWTFVAGTVTHYLNTSRLWRWVFAFSSILLTVLTIALIVFTIRIDPPNPSNGNGTTDPKEGSTSHFAWCDRFDEPQLAPWRWEINSDKGLIRPQNGVLNLKVDASESAKGGGLLAKNPENRKIKKVSFITTLEKSHSGKASGGAGVGINFESGRDIALKIGYASDDPQLEFWACRTEECGTLGSGNYDDYATEGSPFPVGEPVSMRIVRTDEGTEFYIEDSLTEFSPDEREFQEYSPMADFGFTMYADIGSKYHVTVDNVCVDYAGG